MSGWRVAPALDALYGQLNALAPHRSRVSDGSIGDAAHATRDSDHNPWLVLAGQAWVTARDFTHDPGGGLDCARLAASLRTARDDRIKYVIYARRIMSGAGGTEPWTWRAYTGTNPHTKHLHLSVVADRRALAPTAWVLPGWGQRPVLQAGDAGDAVRALQRALHVAPDGEFGPMTDAAVRAFQRSAGLVVDGVVGPATWAALDRRVL